MSKAILKASIGVTIVMVIGNLLSFVKEASIANFFGVSADVDAYTIAIQIPVLVFSFVSVAIQSVVIPIYSDILYNSSENERISYIDSLITLLILGSTILAFIGIIFSGPLVYVFAPGFSETTHNLSSTLLKITFPSIIFSIVSQVLIAVLNVHKKFVINSFSVYFVNITLILFIVSLHNKFGIASACLGQLAGDFFKCAFIIFLARKFYKLHVGYNFKEAKIIRTLKNCVPVIWSISIAEVNAIVNRIVSSFLFVGSIAAISYAQKINTVLLQLFVSAIATIIYPLYAEATAQKDLSKLNRRVNSTFSAYSLFLVPLALGVIVFREEVVSIAFGRGAFNAKDIFLTQNLLGVYSAGMLFMAFRSTLNNVFYSMNDTKTPAINASIGAVINIILNIILPIFWGIMGIAIATTISAIYITSALLFALIKKYKAIELSPFFKNLRGVLISSCFMTLLICVYRHFMDAQSPFVVMIIGLVIGIVIYFLAILILRVPIAKQILQIALSKRT